MGYRRKDPEESLPEFGVFLASIRRMAGIKHRTQAVDTVKRRELSPGISYDQITADEAGRVSDIPADRLKAYAELYKVPYAEIVARLIEEKYGVKMIPDDPDNPVSIKDVVPQENAPFLEELNQLLSGEERERLVACLNMLLTAFPGPNTEGRPAAHAEGEANKAKKKGAA